MSYINQDVFDASYQNKYTHLKNYILLSLGYPVIRVELTEEQILTAIIDAVTLYHKYAVVDLNVYVIDVVENPCPIPTDPITGEQLINKEYIHDIIFPASFFDSLGAGLVAGGYVGEFEGTVLPIFGFEHSDGIINIIKNFDLGKYYMYLQKLEDIKNIVGLNKMWEIVNNKIQTFPASIIVSRLGIVYKGKLTDEEIEEQDWIKKYALSRAKLILGTIRSKLSGINAAGINLAADGEALKSEAKEEISKLEEILMGMGRPMPFIQV